MKYKIADTLEPATTEGGRAVEAFMEICPPADRENLDREWMEMAGMFVKGWLAKSSEQKEDGHITRHFKRYALGAFALGCIIGFFLACARLGVWPW